MYGFVGMRGTPKAGAAGPALHWSFDQNHSQQQPGFGAELVATLRGYYRKPTPGDGTVYQVLPNFWSGYQPAPVTRLAIGSVEVNHARASATGETDYRVTARNTTSGEHATYAFRATADRWRSLTGEWRIEIRNDAGGSYRRHRATGSLGAPGPDAARPIRLNVNGVTLPAGTWSGSRPLTTPWALLDVLPELQEGCELALLEELDRLREPVRLTPLGPWQWPPPDADLGAFTGWCAHGRGLPPTYYWVDAGGTVAVASTLFRTWVASAASKGDAE